MKSRITIEVDFENNNRPVIQIIHKKSDDVRDNLLSAFLEQFGGQSSWCHIKWAQSYEGETPDSSFARIFITPILPERLKEQASVMIDQAGLGDRYEVRLKEISEPKTQPMQNQ